MKNIFIQHSLLFFIGMTVFSGCAKQPLVASNSPTPAAVQTEAKAVPAPEKSAAVAASGATASVVKEKQSSAKENESATTAATLQAALRKIHFDYDSSTLSATARHKLDVNYDVMKKNSTIKIRIEGHCDERGSDEYNLALGERRAQAAANYLNMMGIPGERISIVSYGKEKPGDPGHDENAWAMNRRDEFVITSR